MARRRKQGPTGTEAMRCLKCYIARDIYRALYKQPRVTVVQAAA
jgi:hypothetical protein